MTAATRHYSDGLNWLELVFRLMFLIPIAALLVIAFWAAECRPKRVPEPPAQKTPHTGQKPWVTITVGR